MSKAPDISVVVPVYNEEENVAKLVDEMLRPISHRKNAGQSRAVRSGVMAAKGHYIATLDGDGQNDPADIPALYAQITRADAPEDLALIGGRRAKRQDSWAKKIGSRFGNGVRRKLLNDQADDTGCGLKVFTREAFLRCEPSAPWIWRF